MFHEIALRIAPRDVQTAKYRNFRPLGSVMDVFSDRRKRRKWLETVCDLARPDKRAAYRESFTSNTPVTTQQWDVIESLWTQSLWDAWFAIDRGPESKDKDLAIEQLWQDRIESAAGWKDALGTDPRSQVPLCETFIWGYRTLRQIYVVTNQDLTTADLESRKDDIDEGGVMHPRYRLDWENSLGLSAGTLAEIHDPKVALHPRFDLPVTGAMFTEVASVLEVA